ncbi:MAG: hypothetical protein OXF46_02120 [Rhodobacteraceae bacterium]|nr:hypothetical protein [Paracoccaceae bacterium]
MTLFQFNDNNFTSVEETTFSDEGIKERDLQTLIKTQPELIKKISPDTLIVYEEFSNWEDSQYRIDLLGIDSEENLVVIELKRTKDGGYMDLQAVRYAAMISAMTFDELVGYFQKFLSDNNEKGNARDKLYDHFGKNTSEVIELGQNVKIVLASLEFSIPLTTSVLWLNGQGCDIRCVRMRPYNNDGKILLDVQTIIPLPETNEFQTKLRKRSQSGREQKKVNNSKFNVSFGGITEHNLDKRKMMYLIFSKLFEYDENPEKILEILPSKIKVFDGLLEDEEVRSRIMSEDKGAKLPRTERFFCKDNQPVQYRGKTYVLSNQWAKDTLGLIGDLGNKFPKHNIKVSEVAPE